MRSTWTGIGVINVRAGAKSTSTWRPDQAGPGSKIHRFDANGLALAD
jgi:hypothetical protein